MDASLTSAERGLLSLCAKAIGCRADEPMPPFDEAASDEAYSLAMGHRVSSMIVAAAPDGLLSSNVKLLLIAAAEHDRNNLKTKYNLMIELLALFAEHGIPTMMLKGFGMSRYYPRPELRSFSDIDYYQFGHWREADRLLEERYKVKSSTEGHHHSHLTIRGVLIENHYDFIERYSSRGANRLEKLLKAEAEREPRRASFAGRPCLLPPPTFNALFLLRHASLHFAADIITLRFLTDWVLFCRAEQEHVDWSHVSATARDFGFLPFVATLDLICAHYFAGHRQHLFHPEASEIEGRMLSEIVRLKPPEPPASKPAKRLLFKWRRRKANRWKHDICFAAPYGIDLLYAIFAKLLKPHTILH